jgi:hypothetical protein
MKWTNRVFPGEIVDLDFVEHVNRLLEKKLSMNRLCKGPSSLEVDSFYLQFSNKQPEC